MKSNFRLALGLTVLMLTAAADIMQPSSAAAAAQAQSGPRTYLVTGSPKETDLSRLREALLKISGIQQVEVRATAKGATLHITGATEATILSGTAKKAGYVLRQTPVRVFMASGSTAEAELARLSEALRKVEGVEQATPAEDGGRGHSHQRGCQGRRPGLRREIRRLRSVA